MLGFSVYDLDTDTCEVFVRALIHGLQSGEALVESSVRGLLFRLILISYKLMQQDMFNFIKEGTSVEKMQMLEEKIVKAIDKLKSLGKENSVLNEKISELQGDLVKKDEEIRSVKQDLGNVDILMTDIDKLKNERETVKSQVENLIKELDSVEL